MKKYHKDGTQPNKDQIFVFGSNESGIHGAGAALAARTYYGAIWGEYNGMTGNSYAIPTKDKVVDTLPLDNIRTYINQFVEYSINNPDKQFFVTRIGCGLAGLKDEDIAPMFKKCGSNCSFAEEWKKYIE
jgi:hypothetical protein